MPSDLLLVSTCETPKVITTVSPNIQYLQENRILTSSEFNFLVLMGTILQENNLINYDPATSDYLTELELAKKIGLSRKTTSSTIQSLCTKGVLRKCRISRSNAKHQIYLNPHLTFYGADSDGVCSSVKELFVADDGSPLLMLPIQI